MKPGEDLRAMMEARHTRCLEGRGESSTLTHHAGIELSKYRDRKLVLTATLMFCEREAARMQKRADEAKEEEAMKAKEESAEAVGQIR